MEDLDITPVSVHRRGKAKERTTAKEKVREKDGKAKDGSQKEKERGRVTGKGTLRRKEKEKVKGQQRGAGIAADLTSRETAQMEAGVPEAR